MTGARIFIAGSLLVAACAEHDPSDRARRATEPLSLETDTKLEQSVVDEDTFGFALALEADTLVVGAPTAPGGARAYAFTRQADGWSAPQTIIPPAPSAGLEGVSLAISGDLLVMGDPWASPVFAQSGAAYVYRRVAGQWTLEQSLTPSAAAKLDHFGISVALDGSRIVVGAYAHDGAAPDAGAAYVFSHDGAQWLEEQRILPEDNPEYQDLFGISVAIEGDLIAVGSYKRSGAASPYGAIYLYTPNGADWSLAEKLPNSTGRYMGENLVLRDGLLIAGTPGAAQFTDPGSVRLFAEVSGSWQQVGSLSPDEPNSAQYGEATAFDGTTLVVGCDEPPLAYVYTRGAGNTFVFETKLSAWDTPPAAFGESVGVSGGTVAVGAAGYLDLVTSTTSPGAVYVYRDPEVAPGSGGSGGAGAAGTGAAAGSSGAHAAGDGDDDHSLYACALPRPAQRSGSAWLLVLSFVLIRLQRRPMRARGRPSPRSSSRPHR